MPIGGRPILEYWLGFIKNLGSENVLINTHYRESDVNDFIKRECFNNWITISYEQHLLGTAGTLIKNATFFKNSVILLIHGDNWVNADLINFSNFHFNHRRKDCLISMMIFETENPENSGIVEIDDEGVVIAFHEKQLNAPGKKANAAVYLLEPEVLNWLILNPWILDFSTEVIPNYIGKIATWEHKGFFRDIGTPEMLKNAQKDPKPYLFFDNNDNWSLSFLNNPIHKKIELI